MTVCIAALADDGKGLVLAADRMVTAGFPMAYEHEREDVEKMAMIATNAAVLISGNIQWASEIIAKAKRELGGNPATVEQIAEVVRKEYQGQRQMVIRQTVLEPRGLSLMDFYNMHQRLNAGVLAEIEGNLSQLNLNVEFIVAGCTDTLHHIYTISHPGMTIVHDSIGHVCIGSGGSHATYHLIGSNYRKTLKTKDVLSLVEAAKKKAEVAPGVGEATVTRVFDPPKAPGDKT